MPNHLSSTRGDGARNVGLLVYALQGLTFFTGGLTLLAGVIINYVKRDIAAGTWVQSHFDWQIRTFWWALLWSVVGGATTFLLVGWLIIALNGLWLLYRTVRGVLRLLANESMPQLEALS